MSDWDEDDGEAAGAGGRRRLLSNGQVLAFIGRQWLRRPLILGIASALTLLAVGLDLCIPWAAGRLVDSVSHTGPAAEQSVWSAWGVFVGLYLAFCAARNSFGWVWNPFAARNMEEMTNAAFARVQSFSADWHGDTFAGATVRRVSRAMWGYDSASDALLLFIIPSILVLVGLGVSMLARWPVVGLFSLVICALYVGQNVFLTARYVRPANLKSNALDSRIGAALADAVSGNAVVKSFGAEAREGARLAAVLADWRTAVTRTWNRFQMAWLVQNLLLAGLQAGLSGLILWQWTHHRASAGDVAFAISAFMLMAGYLRNMGENIRMLQKGLDDTVDVAAYMRTEPQVADAPGAEALRLDAADAGQIRFDRVTFRYKSQPDAIYADFSLTIRQGERVALVGPTGSGKSTFVKLVQRLYDLDGGRILIGGQDIAHVTQVSLRQAIAVVPQDPALFHRTIAENIAYARPDATPDEIAAAARRARAHDFVMRLPKGYDTLVGERGVKLSGGERQRVAIARAFLADAPILILDEATSSLDVETERDVAAASEALMKGRTTIVIAHRLSTIRGADRILVFQDGRVVEEGRHADLVGQGGAYARLSALANA
jgi:ATP-binding cassette subfamily B protein